jgi:hypothetical protein
MIDSRKCVDYTEKLQGLWPTRSPESGILLMNWKNMEGKQPS